MHEVPESVNPEMQAVQVVADVEHVWQDDVQTTREMYKYKEKFLRSFS